MIAIITSIAFAIITSIAFSRTSIYLYRVKRHICICCCCHKCYSELFTSGILIVPYCEIVWGKNVCEKDTYETAPVCLIL